MDETSENVKLNSSLNHSEINSTKLRYPHSILYGEEDYFIIDLLFLLKVGRKPR
jgi:hypothetical protein